MPQNEKLIIKSSIVMASSNAGKFAIGDFKNGISLADCEIMSPAGGSVKKLSSDGTDCYGVVGSDGKTLAEKVFITPVQATEGIFFDGERVTEDNYEDILGGGEASYDPDSNTLTLHKDIDGFIWNRSISGLKLTADKDVTVSNSDEYYALRVSTDTTVTGSHKLTFSANAGISLVNSAALTIKDAQVVAGGKWGIQGLAQGEALKVVNSKVNASGTYYGIGDLGKSTELIGCAYAEPENAVEMYSFVPTGISYTVCYSDGTVAKIVIIEPGHSFLKGDVNRDGVVDLSDYSDLAKYLAEWTDYDEIVDVQAADLNNSGGADLEDLSILAKCFAEWNGYRETYLD